MEIDLTKGQIAKLKDFFIEADNDHLNERKGVIQAQVYGKFMTVHYIKNECAMEMREVMKRHHLERFRK